MNYGTINKEYIVNLSFSSNGNLKGGTRSTVIIFKDTDTGEEIDLGEEESSKLLKLLDEISKRKK